MDKTFLGKRYLPPPPIQIPISNRNKKTCETDLDEVDCYSRSLPESNQMSGSISSTPPSTPGYLVTYHGERRFQSYQSYQSIGQELRTIGDDLDLTFRSRSNSMTAILARRRSMY